MKIIYRFILFSILFNTVPVYSQQYDEIEIKAEAILISMAENSIFPENDFLEIKNLLLSKTERKLGNTGSVPNVETIEELTNHLLVFEAEKFGVNTDSALILFVGWYLHLQRTYYYPNRESFFKSSKPKILFFSTSVSCHCTLEMCKKQLIDILKLKREKKEVYSFLVVDAFGNNELQKDYNALFVPTVLVFDEENKLQLKIEYKENMIDSLTNHLNKI